MTPQEELGHYRKVARKLREQRDGYREQREHGRDLIAILMCQFARAERENFQLRLENAALRKDIAEGISTD